MAKLVDRQMVFMPHPGHLIVARDCRFHLNTYVNGFIVSTVGEYWPDREVRKIISDVRKIKINGKGAYYDVDYMKKIGFEELGCDRLYETMVFKAKKVEGRSCCPYEVADYTELDFAGYNTPEDAYDGHMEMCEKYLNHKTEGKRGAKTKHSKDRSLSKVRDAGRRAPTRT